jgi:hypothetical protein
MAAPDPFFARTRGSAVRGQLGKALARMKSVAPVSLLVSSLLAACATPHAPLTRENLGRAGEPPPDSAVIVVKDLGLNVLAIDGSRPSAQAVHVRPGVHLLLIEVMKVSPSRGLKAVIEVRMVAEARHAYTLFVVFDKDLSGYEVYADDKGDAHDPACFGGRRLPGPAGQAARCPDAAVSSTGDPLSPDSRITQASRLLGGSSR